MLLYFKCTLALKSIGYVIYLSSHLLLHISFSASYRFHQFSLNVLFPLKPYKGTFGNLTTVNNISFNLEVHAFRYPRGYENEGLGWVCESELETLPGSEISLAPN